MTEQNTPNTQQPLPRHRLPYGSSPYISSKEYWAFRKDTGDTPAKIMIAEASAKLTREDLSEEAVVTAIETTLEDAMTSPVKFTGLAVYIGQMTESGVVRLINSIRKHVGADYTESGTDSEE